jgi:antitoxin YefM
MEIHTAKQAQENLNKLINLTHDYREPIYIVGDKNKGVLISEEEYSGMQETLYILSVPGMKEKILEADKEPNETCSKMLDW